MEARDSRLLIVGSSEDGGGDNVDNSGATNRTMLHVILITTAKSGHVAPDLSFILRPVHCKLHTQKIACEGSEEHSLSLGCELTAAFGGLAAPPMLC